MSTCTHNTHVNNSTCTDTQILLPCFQYVLSYWLPLHTCTLTLLPCFYSTCTVLCLCLLLLCTTHFLVHTITLPCLYIYCITCSIFLSCSLSSDKDDGDKICRLAEELNEKLKLVINICGSFSRFCMCMYLFMWVSECIVHSYMHIYTYVLIIVYVAQLYSCSVHVYMHV